MACNFLAEYILLNVLVQFSNFCHSLTVSVCPTHGPLELLLTSQLIFYLLLNSIVSAALDTLEAYLVYVYKFIILFA